jgi:phosphatidylglycerophosphatase A
MKQPDLFCKIIATGFGSGYCPVAPGTAGTVAAVLVWTALYYLLPAEALLWTTGGLIALFTPLGVWSAGAVERIWGKDPARVVVDEMVGVWIALPAAAGGAWYYAAAAFVLFRLFDIFKPLGIRRMESFGGGWGIMLDDMLAGIYSFLILTALRWWTG